MAHQILKIAGVHQPTGYSHAARVGNTVYLAGQVALDAEGRLVGPGDFPAQLRQVFHNLIQVLKEAGGGLENVVKMTTFLTHAGFIQPFRDVRGEFLRDPFPPHTLLIVESLARPEFLIEVEATAVLD